MKVILEKIVEKYNKKTRVIYAYINEDIKWNYTGSRNLAFWISRGDFISVEDNDHIPSRKYYEDSLKAFEENPEIDKTKSHKRWVVDRNDVLTKEVEDWDVLASRPAHQDCNIITRELYIKVKGYDERFAGAYGWSATDWRRRTLRAGVKSKDAGYLYVLQSPKTRGLSGRNYHLARNQDKMQSPNGVINFTYEYEILSDKK